MIVEIGDRCEILLERRFGIGFVEDVGHGDLGEEGVADKQLHDETEKRSSHRKSSALMMPG